MSNRDLSTAKNFDFSTITQWRGYNSASDPTNIAENLIVQGSQNIYKKLNGNLAVRPGLKRIGAADTTLAKVDSEFVWNTAWGATYPMWVSNGKLQVSINNAWYTLLTGLTKTRYVFDKWWDNTLKQDKLLFVKGDSDIQSWAGGSATIQSTTSNTITKVGAASWTAAFFLAGTNTVVINGTTYTYTGGQATTTLTGVSPDPTGEAIGSMVLQSVSTTSNTPATGFSNDFIKVINNQAYIGSYVSRLCYISSNTDFTNFTVPTPRYLGSPELLTLDSTLNGIAIKNGNAVISIGTSEWATVTFEQTTGTGAVAGQETTKVELSPTAKGAAAYAHEFISNSGDNVIYLSKDQQVRAFGNFNDLFYNAFPSLSQEISTELSAENFSLGNLKCIGDFTYLTSPSSGKTYLYQVRQSVDPNNRVVVERLWHSPFILGASRIDEVSGVVVAFSNANPQVYQVWNTGQYHDDSPSGEPLPYICRIALAYWPGGVKGARRQGLYSFDKTFSEGYLAIGTPLNLTVNYNYQGSLNQITVPINSQIQAAYLFAASVGSLGDSSLGDKPLGDEISSVTENTNYPKFKVIKSLGLTNCFEYQLIYSSEAVDSQWELLASGTNVKVESEQEATFLINKAK